MADRPNPFESLEELFGRLNRQFGDKAQTWEMETGGESQFDFGAASTNLDLADHGDEFVVTVDVPGYEADDLTSSISGETLLVSGERERETADDEDDRYIRRERQLQSFSRQVQLPEPVDVDAVHATVNNGVLTIHLPKLEASGASHSIDID
ncbi:heat-shock protein Hsp20 [Natronococcus pandeyae]|uniref:Heat-shock protein Hsp20 n=1 Tax=Natronococcus pandeyae TaxID=2055836 RepID=A0A8J8Q7G6_9EURY|nr:Hsp20/alpha crystallin family protein [Natronococcus pandeyae]TYL38685.1 heat-shock protein Hsp20 [Natronococcus pandeyae]